MAWLLRCRCSGIKTLDLIFLRPCRVQSRWLLAQPPLVGSSLLSLCLLFNCVEKTPFGTTLNTRHGIAKQLNKSEPLALISILFLSSAFLLQLATSFLPLQLQMVCLSPLFRSTYVQQVLHVNYCGAHLPAHFLGIFQCRKLERSSCMMR